MRKIPIIIPYFTQDESELVNEVLESGWVAQGPKVIEFEKAIAVHECVEHAIATTSCTTALHLSMTVLGVKEGMDVIVPSFTFIASVNSITYTGATPILVDVCKDTYNIDVKKALLHIENNYINRNNNLFSIKNGNLLWGILAVHQFGLCADMIALSELAKKFNIKVLEDAACAIGAKINNTSEGGFGNVSCLSFHPRKSITTGEGGMILTNDEKLAASMKRLRNHGASISADKRHTSQGFLLPDFNEIGFNYRMNDIQAAIGLAQVKKLDWMLEERCRRAKIYDRLIQDRVPFLIRPKVPDNFKHTYQSYVCLIDTSYINFTDIEKAGEFRNRLLASLEEHGISTRQGTHAVHMLGYYKSRFKYFPKDLPNAYECDRLSITLPLYIQMTDSDQEYIIETIKKIKDELIRNC